MKDIKVFNSLTNKVEVFKPIKEGEVSMYICGPTVYSSPHIGNFRPVICFDVLRRLLIAEGYKVTFVSNYTDVDDKIINRSKELGITEKELTTQIIEEFRDAVYKVGSLQPDITPKPTEYMDKIISYVGDLEKVGAAYAVDGDVYFKVDVDKEYGELSGNSIDKLMEGARIEVSSKKQSPIDFALWKKTEEGIKWDSPWGAGRPGWHTECCVMINSIFKDQNGLIDIHGGGFDLKFPHHENEIAQSIAHNKNKLANYWIHNGFINFGTEKMSKSLGNVVLAKDVINNYGGLAFRLMTISSHYRAPLAFTEDNINDAKKNIDKLSIAFKQAAVKLQLNNIAIDSINEKATDVFYDALRDDLNTPNAVAELYEMNKKVNGDLRTNPINYEALKASFGKLKDGLNVLGLTLSYPTLTDEDKVLFGKYNEAKAAKDFALSDQYRNELIAKGVL